MLVFLINRKQLRSQKFEKQIKMVIFHLSQFEHEPFCQYLSRLNDYRAQYVLFQYEK